MKQPIRRIRTREVLELDCHACGRTIEAPYYAATQQVVCGCGATLSINLQPVDEAEAAA
jgi:hypothetical protein